MERDLLTRTRILAFCLLLATALPTSAAPQTHEEVFLLGTQGSLVATVTYADGLASTRMGFLQLEGASGGPSERFAATAVCTEWIGVFTQVLVLARERDHVNHSEVRVFGALAATPGAAPAQEGTRFTLDALGPHAWRGSLLVCDDPQGEGLVRLNVQLNDVPFAHADPALVRLTVEDSA